MDINERYSHHSILKLKLLFIETLTHHAFWKLLAI